MNEYTYEVLDTGVIKRTDSEGVVWFIPNEPTNSDYVAYLEFLETPAPKGK